MTKNEHTYIEIDLGAVRSNVHEVRKHIQDNVGLMVVVKANAYGHGALEVAKEVVGSGAGSLAVSDVEEGILLREAGFKCPILVLGPTSASESSLVVYHDLSQAVSTKDFVEELSREAVVLGRTTGVHINIDTGIERVGVHPHEAIDFAKHAIVQPGITVEGVFTHFAEANCPHSQFTERQLKLFRSVIEELERAGIAIPIKHAANSAAIFHFPESHFDMVRPGIAIYGLYPSDESGAMVHLSPAMSFRTQIARLRNVPPGTGLSYDRSFTTTRDSVIATLPVGYADGYPCSASNTAQVLVHGTRAPVVGSICMDMTLVDVSHIPGVRVGDDVMLFGTQGDSTISAAELARWAGTISYDIVCGIRSRVPRRFVHP